jgi:hypothetical protein
MVTTRRGASSLGCLMTLLLLATTAYFGVPAVEAYLRYYRYQDAMRQEIRFAGRSTDHVIRYRLAAHADSLQLPAEARRVVVRRDRRHIALSSDYSEWIPLPYGGRELHFAPHAEGEF